MGKLSSSVLSNLICIPIEIVADINSNSSTHARLIAGIFILARAHVRESQEMVYATILGDEQDKEIALIGMSELQDRILELLSQTFVLFGPPKSTILPEYIRVHTTNQGRTRNKLN
jgi:hypothetical protein